MSKYHNEWCSKCGKRTLRPMFGDGFSADELRFNGEGPLCRTCYYVLLREARHEQREDRDMSWGSELVEKLSATSKPSWRRFGKSDDFHAFDVATFKAATPEMVMAVVEQGKPGPDFGYAVITSAYNGLEISVYGLPGLAPDGPMVE